MSSTDPTPNRRRVSDEQRAEQVKALISKLSEAVAAEDWQAAATYAGNIQRRTRLLAGLGRGG